MTRFKYFLMWSIVALMLSTCTSHGHELELGDAGTLARVRMVHCNEYIVVETEELGIILLAKSGDFTHNSLHYTFVDEFRCVYDIVED